MAADTRVQVDELSERDRAGVERPEPVLDADVIERATREAGLGVDSEHVDHVVLVRAARARWIGVGL